ncbi:MAG: HD-GYP domain-containing protein [Endomicrobiales bacterium]
MFGKRLSFLTQARRASLKISAAWILSSDYLLYLMVKDPVTVTVISIFKGWVFLVVTAVILYLLIMRNLKQLEQSARSLEESETGYRELADSISDISFALDTELRYIYWNKAAENFTGIPADAAFGRHVYEVSPDILGAEGEKLLRQVLKEHRQQSFQHDYRHRGKDYYFDIDAYPVRKGLFVFVKDITARRRTEKKLEETVLRLQTVLDETVTVLASVAEKRDPYIAGHQKRVAKLACGIAREMGVPENEVQGIRVAASLHDIGKISIPAEILNKPGPLSSNEFQIVKLYPRVSYDILKTIEFPWPVADIALQHQEKLDGSGYPSGLSGEQISLGGRILAVADFIDALTSHRPYRPMVAINKVLSEITNRKGTLYDPGVVDAAIELISRKGFNFSC